MYQRQIVFIKLPCINHFFFLWQDDDDSVEKEKMEIFRHLQEKKLQFEAYEKEKQRASLSLRDQDSDMPDIDHETFPGTKVCSLFVMSYL